MIKVVLNSSRRLPFAIDRDCYRKPQAIKLQSCKAESQQIYIQIISASSPQGTLWKWGQKYFKRQRIREFCVKLCLYNVRRYTHNVSPTWLSKYEQNKDINNRYTTIYGKSPGGFNLYKELYVGIKGMLRTGGIVFSREEHINISSTIWSAMKIYKWVTLCRLHQGVLCI